MIESAEEFVRLRYSEVREEYWRAAHESAPLSVWRDVIDRYPDAREWVAHNKTVPIEMLEALIDDPNPQVRRMVAMKNKLTPELLARLAHDPDDGVRNTVATHRNTTAVTLTTMLNDPWDEIREAVESRLASIKDKSSEP